MPSININAGILTESLKRIKEVIDKSPTDDSLRGVKIDIKGEEATILGTDMEIAVSDTINLPENTDNLSTVLPFIDLFDFARKVKSDTMLTITLDNNGLMCLLAGKRYKVSLPTLSVAEFPLMSVDNLDYTFTANGYAFATAIARTVFVVNPDHKNYAIGGLYIHSYGEKMRVVGACEACLAISEIAMPQPIENMPPTILTVRTAKILQSLLNNPLDQNSISLSDTRISAKIGNTVVISKLIDGNFPDYNKIVPQTVGNELRMDRAPLKEALGIVGGFSEREKGGVARMTVSENEGVQINAVRLTPGSAEAFLESAEAIYTGKPMDVSLRCLYLSGMIAVNEGDCVINFGDDSDKNSLITFPHSPSIKYVLASYRA